MDVNEKIVGRRLDGSFYVRGSKVDSEYELIQKALERLSDYEDTDLTPREIENLKIEFELNKNALHKIASGELKNIKSLERIVERTTQKEE